MNWKTDLVTFVAGGAVALGSKVLINNIPMNINVNNIKGTTDVKVIRNCDNQKLFSYRTDKSFFKK